MYFKTLNRMNGGSKHTTNLIHSIVSNIFSTYYWHHFTDLITLLLLDSLSQRESTPNSKYSPFPRCQFKGLKALCWYLNFYMLWKLNYKAILTTVRFQYPMKTILCIHYSSNFKIKAATLRDQLLYISTC